MQPAALQRGVREYDDKQISSYCLKVMEDRDEQLTDLIQSKSLTTANVRQNVINTMCSWETKKKSPCKTEDELLGRVATLAAYSVSFFLSSSYSAWTCVSRRYFAGKTLR
jgi:hypothetical protein